MAGAGLIAGKLEPRILWLFLVAPIATGLTTFLVWPWKPGIVSGAAIGLLAHPVMWALTLPLLILSGESNEPFSQVPQQILFLSFWSLLFVGWLTVPAGALLGWRLTRPAKTG